jgi:hypothetical protein
MGRGKGQQSNVNFVTARRRRGKLERGIEGRSIGKRQVSLRKTVPYSQFCYRMLIVLFGMVVSSLKHVRELHSVDTGL